MLLFLWLVPVVVIYWDWLQRRRHQRLNAISIAPQTGAGSQRFRLQLALVAGAALLCLTALARPRWGERDEIVFSRGRNIVIAVDVSLSMLAEDVRPNRLERARADLRDLLADLKGDRAGLLAFRSGATLLCPLTTDMAFLRHALEGLGPHSAPRGQTNIGAAIETALETFETFSGDHNAIMLISDGEDLEGRALNAAKTAGQRGIPVFAVGIGAEQGSAIPTDGGKTLLYKGTEVVTRLDNQTLVDIATASGGAYIPLQTTGTGRVTLGSLYRQHLRRVTAQDMQERLERRQVERYQWFLIPGLLLLAAAAWLSRGRPRLRRPPFVAAPLTKSLSLLLAIFLGLTLAPRLSAEELSVAGGRDLARSAQAAFRAGRYEEAADAYLDAAAATGLDARTAATFRLNGAIAQLRAGGTTNAAATFREVLRQLPDATSAREGLGAALFAAATAADAADASEGADGDESPSAAEKVALLDEAAAALQQALRDQPTDDLRRRNLAAALESIPALREEARIEAALEKYSNKPPEEILTELLRAQRQAYAEAGAALTNNSPSQIAQLESAARRQDEASDLWLPLAPALMQMLSQGTTNQQQLAQMQQELMAARSRMQQSAASLRDLDPAGVDAIARNEQDALQFFAIVAPPPPILEEAILAQTNALRTGSSPDSTRSPVMDQAAAQAFTSLFQQKFPGWADQLMSGDTAMPGAATDPASADPAATPPLTEEARAEIEELTAATIALQQQALAGLTETSAELPPETLSLRQQALQNLLRIRELLPKPPSQQQSQSEDQQEKQDEQESSESPDQSDQPPPDEGEKEDQQDAGQPEQQPEETQQSEEQEANPEDEKEEKLPEELESMMERVLRQEKEREEARKKQSLPPLLNERDW